MINPCIIGKDGGVEGCITDSVLKMFSEAFVEVGMMKEGLPPGWIEAFCGLASSLEDSLSRWSPAFLSELRRIAKSCKGIASEEFVKKISRIHLDLSRYCRSTAVQEEVFAETVKLFEDLGFRYQGSNVQGIAKDECAFDYKGTVVGVKIRAIKDLFGFWMPSGGDKTATVYCGPHRYSVVERNCPPCRFADALAACISDDCECPADGDDCDDDQCESVADALMQVARMLLR